MSQVSTDPIADMLARIRNAIAVRKYEIRLPYSKVKESIAHQLVGAKFLDKVSVDGKGIEKVLVINIHDESTNARITEIKRLSTPGRRMYTSADKIPTIKRGRGVIIISTSKGVMTGSDAQAAKLGGELICSVY